MDISNLDIGEYASGNNATIYTTDDMEYAVKMSNHGDVDQENFDPIVETGGSCDYNLLTEALFSSLKSGRIVNAKICHYNGEYALISPMNGIALDKFVFAGEYPKKQSIWFMYQIISALNNIHQHHLVHGDVALRNIVFDREHYMTYDIDVIADNSDKHLNRIQFIDFELTTFENLNTKIDIVIDINKDYYDLLSSLKHLVTRIYIHINFKDKINAGNDINFDIDEDITRIFEKIEGRVPLNDILLDPLFDQLNERYADVIEPVKLKYDPFGAILTGNYRKTLFGWIDDIGRTKIIGKHRLYFRLITKEIFDNFVAVNGMPRVTRIQLYGVTAVFITLKILDIPLKNSNDSVIDYMRNLCKNQYTLDEIRNAELEILKLVDFGRILNNVICRSFNHCE